MSPGHMSFSCPNDEVIMLIDQNELQLNLISQNYIKLEDGVNWFKSHDPIQQKEILRKLQYLILQSHARQEDVLEAIEKSNLKKTFTPCTLLVKGQLSAQIAKVVNLNQSEHLKSFQLLIHIFLIADKRRRELDCIRGCHHWWHNLENM
jgi:hypothetical protein